jgi:hypothetical protein
VPQYFYKNHFVPATSENGAVDSSSLKHLLKILDSTKRGDSNWKSSYTPKLNSCPNFIINGFVKLKLQPFKVGPFFSSENQITPLIFKNHVYISKQVQNA